MRIEVERLKLLASMAHARGAFVIMETLGVIVVPSTSRIMHGRFVGWAQLAAATDLPGLITAELDEMAKTGDPTHV